MKQNTVDYFFYGISVGHMLRTCFTVRSISLSKKL